MTTNHDTRPRPATAQLTRALAVVVVSVLVVFLDGMVLNVALPRIQQQLGASQSQQEWAVAAYTLVFAALLLPMGVMGDRYGRRRLLAAGLVLFGIGSLAAAYATSPTYLIAMRAATGVGGAAIVPATLAIISNAFDATRRARAIAIWAAASGLGVSFGPLVAGGLLEAGFWWGSVLLINVPVVITALIGVFIWIPESRDAAQPRTDPLGVVLSIAGLGVLVYGVIRAGQTADWMAAPTLGAILAGVALLALFGWVEAHTRHATLDVRWFRNRALTGSAVAMAFAMFALYGAGLYGIYFLQFDRGYSPLASGVLLLGNAAGVMVAAPLSSTLAKRYGERGVCAAGFVILAVAYAAMVTVDRYTPIALVEVLLVLLGIGSGTVVAPATDVVMASIPRDRAGAGSAFNSAVRSVGGALGIAVLGSILSTTYRSRMVGILDVLPPAVRDAAGESIGGTQIVVSRVHDSLADHGTSVLDAASRSFAAAMHVTAALSAAAVVVALAVVLLALPRPRATGVPTSRSRAV